LVRKKAFFYGRIAAADHHHPAVLVKEAVAGGTVGDTASSELSFAGNP
jgi:hypothetical protein